jgi:hypothetical protein
VPELIRISTSDLHTPDVDSYVEMQNFLRRDVGPVGDRPWIVRVIYANWFYLAVCSMVGALAGWALVEPWFDDNQIQQLHVADVLMFPIVTASIGLFLGAAEGLFCRNFPRAVKCGAVGLGIGIVGGLIAWFPSEMIFGIGVQMAVQFSDGMPADGMPTGLGLFALMVGRAAAWSLAAIPAGMGQGVALGERKVVLNGIVGAMLGGLVGGLLFDPIFLLLPKIGDQAILSRALGFAAIGGFVGLFVGLVEGWTKTAWLLMQKGPLAGKQFILYKDTTILGSSPKADVYLFKDGAIEPRHALITNRAGRFEIEDCETPDGTYVNGIPITQARLRDGDQIVLGSTVLEFSMKETSAH